MTLDKDIVLASLRASDVAAHYGITGPWRGRWMRSSRCAVADHGSDAFGISQDGKWHCWACDTGGDLLKLIAIGERMLQTETEADAARLADGIEAGDLGRNGDYIPYPRYP